MRGVVTGVILALLIGAILWAANTRLGLQAGEAPTPIPSPTPTVPRGEWQGAPELIGTLYLAACHDWMQPYTALRPVPQALLRATAASWPEKPTLRGFLALSKPFYIPRSGKDVGRDVDTWLASHASDVDCTSDIWTEEDVRAMEAEKHIGFFGMARPAVTDGKPMWEMAFGAVRWTAGGQR